MIYSFVFRIDPKPFSLDKCYLALIHGIIDVKYHQYVKTVGPTHFSGRCPKQLSFTVRLKHVFVGVSLAGLLL